MTLKPFTKEEIFKQHQAEALEEQLAEFFVRIDAGEVLYEDEYERYMYLMNLDF